MLRVVPCTPDEWPRNSFPSHAQPRPMLDLWPVSTTSFGCHWPAFRAGRRVGRRWIWHRDLLQIASDCPFLRAPWAQIQLASPAHTSRQGQPSIAHPREDRIAEGNPRRSLAFPVAWRTTSNLRWFCLRLDESMGQIPGQSSKCPGRNTPTQ